MSTVLINGNNWYKKDVYNSCSDVVRERIRMNNAMFGYFKTAKTIDVNRNPALNYTDMILRSGYVSNNQQANLAVDWQKIVDDVHEYNNDRPDGQNPTYFRAIVAEDDGITYAEFDMERSRRNEYPPDINRDDRCDMLWYAFANYATLSESIYELQRLGIDSSLENYYSSMYRSRLQFYGHQGDFSIIAAESVPSYVEVYLSYPSSFRWKGIKLITINGYSVPPPPEGSSGGVELVANVPAGASIYVDVIADPDVSDGMRARFDLYFGRIGFEYSY